MLLNVLDYQSPQAALDAADNGDRIYFPAVAPYIAPLGGWKIIKSLELFGDGMGISNFGSILRAFDKDSPVIEVVTPARNVCLRELQLQRGGTGTGTGVGVLCRSTSSNPTTAIGLRLRGLSVNGFPSHGIHLEGLNASARISSVAIHDIDAKNCGGAGIFLKNAFDVRITDSTFAQNQLNGASATGGSVALRACTFDGNVLATTFPPGTDPQLIGEVTLTACEIVDIDACRFLNVQGPALAGIVRRACVLVDTCGQVGNCQFESTTSQVECRGIELVGSEGGPFVVMGNRFANVKKLIVLGIGVTGCAFYPQYDQTAGGLIEFPALPALSGGAYGAAHIVRPSEVVLRGLQLPVLDSDPAVARSFEGMFAYNPQAGVRVYTSTGWKTVSTVAVVDPP
jgi:hypothetical protein